MAQMRYLIGISILVLGDSAVWRETSVFGLYDRIFIFIWCGTIPNHGMIRRKSTKFTGGTTNLKDACRILSPERERYMVQG